MLIRHFMFLLVLSIFAASTASAQPWEDIDPGNAGWSTARLEAARLHSKALGPTGVMIV